MKQALIVLLVCILASMTTYVMLEEQDFNNYNYYEFQVIPNDVNFLDITVEHYPDEIYYIVQDMGIDSIFYLGINIDEAISSIIASANNNHSGTCELYIGMKNCRDLVHTEQQMYAVLYQIFNDRTICQQHNGEHLFAYY